ncbi:unnamed protein product [Malus baccata var. baccata]
MMKIEEETMAKKLPGKEETARKVKPRPEKTSNGGGRLCTVQVYGIDDVRIYRQGFERMVVSQELKLWLSVEMQEITIEKAMRNEQKCITTMKGLQLFDIETCINSPGNYSCQCLNGCKHEGMDEKSCIKDNKLSKAILLIISLGNPFLWSGWHRRHIDMKLLRRRSCCFGGR